MCILSHSHSPLRLRMAVPIDLLAPGFASTSNCCVPRPAFVTSSTALIRIHNTTSALKVSLRMSSFPCGNKLSELHERQWRNRATDTGAGSDFYTMEFMDPETGEYKIVEMAEEGKKEESADSETEEELLKRFARAALGEDDPDVVGTLFNKMRNPASQTIVKQLEEGIGDVGDLLKDIYRDNPDFRRLYVKVESLIKKEDLTSAREIIEGNYEALLEQLHEGVFGVDQVALLDILAHLYLCLDDTVATEQLLDQARELLELIPDTEKMVGNVLEHVASLYLQLEKPRKALGLFERSLSVKNSTKEDVSCVVRTMIGLANTYSELDMGDRSTEIYKQILVLSEEALGSEAEDLAVPLLHLGSTLLNEGKPDEAELAVDRAIKLTVKTLGENDGRYGVATCVLAQVKGTQGEFERALDLFREGLQVIEACEKFSQDPNLDTIRMEFAALLTVLEREEESQKVLKKVNLKEKKQHDYYFSQQVLYLEKLAEEYALAGELEKAEKALRRSLRLLIANVGRDAIQVSVILQLLATLLHAQPDREGEAEPLVRESLRIREEKYGKYHIAVGEACSYLASILHHQGQDKEAADLMYRVLDIQERRLGYDDPQLEETLEVLHLLLVNLGRHHETLPIIQRLQELKAQWKSSMSM